MGVCVIRPRIIGWEMYYDGCLRNSSSTIEPVAHPHVTPHAHGYSSQHKHKYRWKRLELKTTTALQPNHGDVHNFALSNYLRHIKKNGVHNEKHNGNKGYQIKKFDYYEAGA